MFYFKKLVVEAPKNVYSVIEFTKGLNIICGESNTGKSMVLNCIDFICGGKGDSFDSAINIEKVILDIDFDGKLISMNRELSGNDVSVYSEWDGIETGEYKVNHTAQKNINSVWLKILGINDSARSLRTQDGKTQSLTFRTFLHTLFIDETRVKGPASILAAGHGKNTKPDTAVLTALLYLATGNDYIPAEDVIDPKIKKAKKSAVQSFVKQSLESFKNKSIDELQDFPLETPDELQDKINEVINDISATEGALENATKESEYLADKLSELDNQATEDKVLFNRNQSLLSQYESDIRRLTFIAEGDLNHNKIPVLETCPFCNGKLNKVQGESCIEAAISEVNKIGAQIKDLLSVQDAIQKELKKIEEEKRVLIAKRVEIDNLVRIHLQPKISQLRQHLSDYKESLNMHKAKQMVESLSDVLVSEMNMTLAELPDDFKFDAKAKFAETFSKSIDDALKTIIAEIKPNEFTNLYYDQDTCDIVINGHDKKTQGEGYRAFFNSVFALALQNALMTFEKYSPNFLLIDSPVLSLKEASDENSERVSENMKYGLFKYLDNHSELRQTIIVENSIPKMDDKSANICYFSGDENNGRYGLIENYTNK